MNVLMTGNKGFVGRNFERHLIEDGHVVDGIDIKDGLDCREFFREHGYAKHKWDLVIHLAAIVGGRETIEYDPISVATDLSIDAEMFNWVVETEQPQLVYFSSSAAYPIDLQKDAHALQESDIDFEHIKNPDMTYGWAKLTGEYLAEFARCAGVDVFVFRPFSGYGTDQDLSYPFPAIISRIKERRNPFEIWGGEQVRDFVHIDDIYHVMWAAIDKNYQYPLNICTGRPTSFNQFIKIAFAEAGWWPKRVIRRDDKPTGVFWRQGDPTTLNSIYRPRISLEEGIRRALYETEN